MKLGFLHMHSRQASPVFTAWCLQSTVLIMAHMTKEPFSVHVWPLVVLSAVLVNDRVGIINYNAAALAALAIILAGYLVYVKVTTADAAAAFVTGCSGRIIGRSMRPHVVNVSLAVIELTLAATLPALQ